MQVKSSRSFSVPERGGIYMNTTKWMLFVLGLGLALIAAACGDDDTVTTGDTVAPVTTAAPTTTTAAPATTTSTTETPGEFEPVGTDLTTPLPTGDAAAGEQFWDTPSPVGPGCTSCHTLADASLLDDPSLLDKSFTARGPALFGIADRAGTTREGYSAEEYLRESIVLPAEFLVEGYPITVMPRNSGELLDAQDLADVMAFLMTQSG